MVHCTIAITKIVIYAILALRATIASNASLKENSIVETNTIKKLFSLWNKKREHIWVLLKQVTEKQLPSLYLQWQQPWQQRARADEVTWLLRRETNNISEAGFFAKLRPVVLYFIPPFPFSLFIYLLTLKYFTRYSFSRYAVTLKSVTRFSNTPHISSLSLLRPTLQATMFAVVSQ